MTQIKTSPPSVTVLQPLSIQHETRLKLLLPSENPGWCLLFSKIENCSSIRRNVRRNAAISNWQIAISPVKGKTKCQRQQQRTTATPLPQIQGKGGADFH